MIIMRDYLLKKLWNIPTSVSINLFPTIILLWCGKNVDPVLKEAAANAAGANATMPSLPSSGGATPMGAGDGEQEMKENSEPVQNPGSQ